MYQRTPDIVLCCSVLLKVRVPACSNMLTALKRSLFYVIRKIKHLINATTWLKPLDVKYQQETIDVTYLCMSKVECGGGQI